MSIIAQCKYPAKAYDTQYGRRVNAVFTTPDGEELKIWGNAGQSSLELVEDEERYLQELKKQQVLISWLILCWAIPPGLPAC